MEDDDLPQYLWDPGASRVVYEDDRKRTKQQAEWIQRRWDERTVRRELEKNTGPATGRGTPPGRL